MDIRQYGLSWASSAYAYCILTLLSGDGVTALYYNDRRGQPELHQAMDNAPLLPASNLLPFPPGQDGDIPFLLTEKTAALLSEALHMLQKIKDVRERKWFEAFVLRLGSLANDLEEDNSVKVTNEVQEPVLQPFDIIGHTVPTWSSIAIARKFYKLQTKNQVTSAQVNDVLPGNINRETVTKPSLVSGMKNVNNDDLVKQLHNQDRRMKSKSLEVPPARLLESTVITQAVMPPPNNNGKSKSKHIVQAQVKVRKYKKEPEKNVRNLFEQINSHYLTDFTTMDFVHGQKYNLAGNGSVSKVDVRKDEGESIARGEGTEESMNSTVSPSWQHVMKATHDGVSKAQFHEPIKYFVPVEPTMSDEMERELRAGKIVVLSHSLVKTNFKSKHSKDEEGPMTQVISPSQIPESDAFHVSSKLSRNHSGDDE